MKLFSRTAALISAFALISGVFVGCSNTKDESSVTETPKSNDIISLADFAETLGAGWNLGNTLEANTNGTPDETVWGNPEADQEIFDAVAAAGFKTVRVPVSYLSKIDDTNGHKVDEAWLDRVREVVDYCYNSKLNVIINIHGDGYYTIDGGWLLCGEADQEPIKEKYAAVWKQIAEKFKDYDEHLIFESMNEEFDGTYTDPKPDMYENINEYNQIFIDTVRETGGENSHRWLMFPGWNTNIDYTVGDYGFKIPEDKGNSASEGRLVVSVHCYDPWDYCGEENIKTYLWGERGQEIIDINKASKKAKAQWGEEKHIEKQMTKLKEAFVDNGIPVIIGEYGCIDKSHADAGIPNQINENRAYWDGFFAGTAAVNGITPVYWDNGWNGKFGFGLFDRSTHEQTQPEIITSIVQAVENKDPKVGMSARVTGLSVPVNDVPKTAFFGIQTAVYTFRNPYSDGTYGYDSEWFNTLIKWEDTDGDGKNDIVDSGAKFTDAEITENGRYSVGVSGYDFSADSESLNMLFVSSNIPFKPSMKVTNVTVCFDDIEVPVEKPVVMEDSSGNLYIELVNIYNTELPELEYKMPKENLTISFDIEGV